MYVTPRTLLAIIRLAQALAKMNFRNVVKQLDVDEALRLMEYSIRSLREIAGDKKSRSQARQGHENEDR
jgi:DNA replication licensing factor MCM7